MPFNILDYYCIVVLTLTVLNIFQLIFWSRQNSRLVDKLMCRNYAEYKQIEHLATSPNKLDSTEKLQINDDEVLRELNALLGR